MPTKTEPCETAFNKDLEKAFLFYKTFLSKKVHKEIKSIIKNEIVIGFSVEVEEKRTRSDKFTLIINYGNKFREGTFKTKF